MANNKENKVKLMIMKGKEIRLINKESVIKIKWLKLIKKEKGNG